ncbi:uncharacterized protein LOC116301584 [Actinia tenebrosa]|uniref:Uncharacterized protein LOC116301584 n=1 Tax=Actinia tenebrosa TaxID=6105 RepID=A0A6P8IIG8_ACTTE|nr:uncharacterized protein LOC116301584 [Actinia tenebrosa]
MSIRVRVIFILCGIFLIPGVLTAAKITEEFYEPEENESVQDEMESMEEIIEEPLSIEEFETKSATCKGKQPVIKLQNEFPCGSYPQIIKIDGLNQFYQLNRCTGYVGEKHKCKAVKQNPVYFKDPYRGGCIKMFNETQCQRGCKRKLQCSPTQTFTAASCSCTAKKYYVK